MFYKTFINVYFMCIHKVYTMDIFDNTILCKNCNSEMQKAEISKNGFLLRVIICEYCNEKILHPVDEQNYNKFINLRNKEFSVKMRMVGNSYAVSITKEIVSFMNDQKKIMDQMVKLCFEEMGKLSLSFNEIERKDTNTQELSSGNEDTLTSSSRRRRR